MLVKADWASRMGFNKSVHVIQEIVKPVDISWLVLTYGVKLSARQRPYLTVVDVVICILK